MSGGPFVVCVKHGRRWCGPTTALEAELGAPVQSRPVPPTLATPSKKGDTAMSYINFTRAAGQPLLDAAEIIARLHDPDAAKGPLTDAVLEALGSTPLCGKVVDLLLQSMYAQRAIDLRLAGEDDVP